MLEQQTMVVQEGIFLSKSWLEKAGLGSRLQVAIEAGEIRIITAPPDESEIDEEKGWDVFLSFPPDESKIDEETGWGVFLSLGQDAPKGKLQDASVNHDRYLYGK